MSSAIEGLHSRETSLLAILTEWFLAGREWEYPVQVMTHGFSRPIRSSGKRGRLDVDLGVRFETKSKISEDWDGVTDEIPANRASIDRTGMHGHFAEPGEPCRDAGRLDVKLDDPSARAGDVLKINQLVGLKSEGSQLSTMAGHNGMSFEIGAYHSSFAEEELHGARGCDMTMMKIGLIDA
ncbi:hypothetical protein N7457_000717 [Penicillium paradoxum]|uniref:uncharacterized protein n=1 Tax=Penicillium paradoxum TaxID=176176 RepID=UPI002548C328|nr:uncharacterized protein N7457_000717 [Penicillium paradoxum]KAJ5794118.1 hypothetical protein N7457_000717 [Penicillium paradoxum]